MKNWGDGTNLVHGPTPEAAAEALAAALQAGNCDAVNIRIHVKGLTPAQIEGQIDHHGQAFLPHLRTVWAAA
jgi:hypothetical protein